jgi:hypothetical protein
MPNSNINKNVGCRTMFKKNFIEDEYSAVRYQQYDEIRNKRGAYFLNLKQNKIKYQLPALIVK